MLYLPCIAYVAIPTSPLLSTSQKGIWELSHLIAPNNASDMSQDRKSPRVTERVCALASCQLLWYSHLSRSISVSHSPYLCLTLKGVGWFAKKSQNVGRADCPAAAFLWSVSEKWQHVRRRRLAWRDWGDRYDDSKSCHSQRKTVLEGRGGNVGRKACGCEGPCHLHWPATRSTPPTHRLPTSDFQSMDVWNIFWIWLLMIHFLVACLLFLLLFGFFKTRNSYIRNQIMDSF